MKRILRISSDLESIDITISVFHSLQSECVLATDIEPVLDDDGLLDMKSLSDYNVFIENLWVMIDYYGFQIIKAKDNKSYPFTSKYVWLASADDADNKSIPLMIKLRVSDHKQSVSLERMKQLKKIDREEAEQLKQPKDKRRQRYVVKEITVNKAVYHTYEEALNAADRLLRDWLKELNVDMTDIEPFGEW